jgi:hypothetical protein
MEKWSLALRRHPLFHDSNILAEKLLSDAKRFDDLAVAIDILTLEIIQ